MIAHNREQTDEYLYNLIVIFPYTIEEVWSVLTDNNKLKKWMSNLQIEDLKTGGIIKFDMMDGTFLNIDILECQIIQYLNSHGIKIVSDLKYIKRKMDPYYYLKNTFMN